MPRPVTLLCLASYFKGARLMAAAKKEGAHVILVTLERLKDEPWPMDVIDERFLLPDINAQPDIQNAVTYLARTRHIDRILALDEYDTVTAARLREHMRIPGLGDTTGRHFRDKLAMRVRARESGISVPGFAHVLNHDDLRTFMANVPGPWLLKPRTEASAMGIRKISRPDELWPTLDELGDRASDYLMEAYVPGGVYHVDAISTDGRVVFEAVSKYARPPLDIYQGGGVFVTHTVDPSSDDAKALVKSNAELLKAFGMVRGATHAEFIKGEDGTFYFLEVAARVGGASIDLLVEHATGVNLWEEWARVEIANVRAEPFTVAASKAAHAGLMVCLARDAWPDLSGYSDPEVAWRMRKKHHAGLIVAADSPERMMSLLDNYTARFGNDFLAVAPPLENEKQMQSLE